MNQLTTTLIGLLWVVGGAMFIGFGVVLSIAMLARETKVSK